MLRIIVVGAGIAGLAAGIALRRAGHRVVIYERSSMNNEIGAAIHLPPNASRFLVAWGLDPSAAGFVLAKNVSFQDPVTLELLHRHSHDHLGDTYGAVLWFAHRVDLHDALKKMALDSDAPGTPVEIHLNADVVGYDPAKPSISLASGEVIHGDVVVGADGLHSIACEAVLGGKNPPIAPTHYNCCYRFLVPAAALDADPETASFNQDMDGRLIVLADNEAGKRIVTYPCRKHTVHNFVGLLYDVGMKDAKKEDYLAGVEHSVVQKEFAGFHPQILAIINKATEIKRWPLLYRQPLPTLYKGKLVLAGDAAHPMLPHLGQGGAQGLEDAVALGIVLCGASGSEEIERRLGLYERIRRNRTSIIQILSNVGVDQTQLIYKELAPFIAEKDIPKTPSEHFAFQFGYDIVKDTVKVMKEYDASFELPLDFIS